MAETEEQLARVEILRRCTEAGLDEREMDLLLMAFEAGALRNYAAILDKNDEPHLAAALKGWASGVRPRNWRRLLSDDGRAS